MTAAARKRAPAPEAQAKALPARLPTQQTVADPHVTVGRYRILQRTDGAFVVCDFDRPNGDATVATAASLKDAIAQARALPGGAS